MLSARTLVNVCLGFCYWQHAWQLHQHVHAKKLDLECQKVVNDGHNSSPTIPITPVT